MRRPEDHLSSEELASLRENDKVLESVEPAERQLALHLESCEECQELAQIHRSLFEGDDEGGFKSTESCPDSATWLNLVAGTRSEDPSMLLGHAVECAGCARALKEAIDLFKQPQSEVSVPLLQSATPEWQLKVARRMASSQSIAEVARVTKTRRSLRRKWVTVPIAASLLVSAALVGLAIWRRWEPSNEQLLASAYNKQRILALRLPGSEPVPLASGTRGAAGVDQPAELLELKLRARQHLDRNPNDPYWHQVQGEISLLENNGYAARRNLEFAQLGNRQLPNLQADLAAAWFEIGENTSSAEAYARAAEILSKQIEQDSTNSVMLYNNALCNERLGFDWAAVEDLLDALAHEQSDAWRRTIRAELDRLSGASGLSAAPRSNKDKGAREEYETSLTFATEQLLPRWQESVDVRSRLIRIANLGIAHRDTWLADWVSARHSAKTAQADLALSRAVQLGTAGIATESLVESRKAFSAYREVADRPGELRAQLAVIYALQRLDRSDECLSSAASLEANLADRQYSWIRTQLYIEQADCEGMAGNVDVSARKLASAIKVSKVAQLPQLQLRAVASQALLLNLVGKPAAAWQLNTEGIRFCAKVDCPPIREYQLLYNSAFGAEELGLESVAGKAMSKAVEIAAETGDTTTQAYALETLATMESRVGKFDRAERNFIAAEKLFTSRSNLPALYRAEWETDRSKMLLARGLKQQAFEELHQHGSEMDRSTYQDGRLRYLEQLSAVQLALGKNEDALSSAWRGVLLAERSLPTLAGPAAREQWERENKPLYAHLVTGYLQSGRSEEALNAWERFREAPSISSDGSRTTRTFKAEQKNSVPLGHLVVIARIDAAYIVWFVEPKPFRVLGTTKVSDGAGVEYLAAMLYHWCSDRNSSVRDIQVIGGELYQRLFAPFEPQIRADSTLWLDIDPSLGILPVSAVSEPSGSWFANSHTLVFAPRDWMDRPGAALIANAVDTTKKKILVIDGFESEKSPGVRTEHSETSEIVKHFGHALTISGARSSSAFVLEQMKQADVIHFSGHALSDSESQLLLGGQGNLSKSVSAEDLESIHLNRAQLVVLAACNTAGISSDRMEEKPDLRNALLYSGAKTVVASSWDVDDDSTRELMIAFYKELLGKRAPEVALQNAERVISGNTERRHPFYWASFNVFAN